MMGEIRRFQELKAWQEAHQLVLAIYGLTKNLPTDERFGRISQTRRAAVSVPANIAEGFKRRGIQDKLRFYNVAEGSLEKVKYYLILSQDRGTWLPATSRWRTQRRLGACSAASWPAPNAGEARNPYFVLPIAYSLHPCSNPPGKDSQ